MAYYSKENGITLNVEEKETFKEISSNFSQKGIKTPITNKIMKWVLGDLSIKLEAE